MFDDSRVHPIGQHIVISCEAYVLFFAMTGTSHVWSYVTRLISGGRLAYLILPATRSPAFYLTETTEQTAMFISPVINHLPEFL